MSEQEQQNTASDAQTVTARDVLRLSLPALGVLAATPIFLLLDTASVGRLLGGVSLAALGTGTIIYSQVTTQLTFLSYGTTARSARLYGAGKKQEAIGEGVQATWIAMIVGFILTTILFVGAPFFTQLFSGNAQVAAQATAWLKVTAWAIPLVLITMAGNGWLRGIQNTRLPLIFTLAGVIPGALLIPFLVGHYGLVGSAIANVTGTAITSSLFLLWLARSYRGSWRPQFAVMGRQLVLGRDLIIRSLSFQVAFVSAGAVAARFGADALAAHQILLQLWNFLSMILDSFAIAAQALVGAALGAGTVALARNVGIKVVKYSSGFALVLAAVFALGHSVIPRQFTTDPGVLAQLNIPWWQLIVLIILGGVVFAFDGVLLGAADAAYLRTISVISVVCGFLPAVWLSYFLDGGLVGVWWGLIAFIGIRLFFVVSRFYSMKWAKV